MVSTEIEFNTRFAGLLSEASGQPAGWIASEKERLLEDSAKRPDSGLSACAETRFKCWAAVNRFW